MKMQEVFDKVQSGVDFNQEPLETQRDALSCVWLPESEEDLLKLPDVWTPERLAFWEATQAKWEAHVKRTEPISEEEREMCIEALRLLDPDAVFGNALSPNTANKEYKSLLPKEVFDYLSTFDPIWDGEGYLGPGLNPPVFNNRKIRTLGTSRRNYSHVEMAALDFHSHEMEDMPCADLCRAFLTLQEHSHNLFMQYTDFPEFVSLDEAGMYHSDTGPAIRYRDGVEHYYIHGSLARRDQILGLPNQYAPDKEAQEAYQAEYVKLNSLVEQISEVGLSPDLEKQIRDAYYHTYGYYCSVRTFDRIVGSAVFQYNNRNKPPRAPELDQWGMDLDAVIAQWDQEGVIVLPNDDGEVG